MADYDRLLQDRELMADFRACMKYRREHMRDVYQFYLARKYDLGFIENMQRLALHSLWIWLPLFYFFPDRETTLCCLLHTSLVLHWDNWWGNAFAGYQHFDCFTRADLKRRYGDRWDDGPIDWSKYEQDTDDD
jgi:hypothetical protein